MSIGIGFNLHSSDVREDVLSVFFHIDQVDSPDTHQQLSDIFDQQYLVAMGNPLPGETERLNNALNTLLGDKK